MGEQIKSPVLITTHHSKFILTLAFICLQPSFLFHNGKLWRHISSSSHVSVFTGNILITIIRFNRYQSLLASNSTFMIDSMHLGAIQICQNLDKHYYCLISETSAISQIDTDFSPFQWLNMFPFYIRLERLKLIY